MLFNNTTLHKKVSTQSFGEYHAFSTMANEYSLQITTKPNLRNVNIGLHYGLDIGTTVSGKAKIINVKNRDKLHAIITSFDVERYKAVEGLKQLSGKILWDIDTEGAITVLQKNMTSQKIGNVNHGIQEVLIEIHAETTIAIEQAYADDNGAYIKRYQFIHFAPRKNDQFIVTSDNIDVENIMWGELF